jgi:hypothetical protein
VQELRKTELWIEIYGPGRFGGQKGLFRRFWAGYSWNFLVVGSFGTKEQGLLPSLGFFRGFLLDFGSVWNG